MFCGECLGYAACTLTGYHPPATGALVVAAAVALVVGGVGAVLLAWLLLDSHREMAGELVDLRLGVAARESLEQQLANRAETHRRLRHDLRGALSPALLTADRLINHDDPKVRRAGEIMVKSVDRASSLLADPSEASFPGGP